MQAHTKTILVILSIALIMSIGPLLKIVGFAQAFTSPADAQKIARAVEDTAKEHGIPVSSFTLAKVSKDENTTNLTMIFKYTHPTKQCKAQPFIISLHTTQRDDTFAEVVQRGYCN